MPSNEAHGRRAEPAREPVADALARLEARLDRAQQAAERLLADAAQRVTRAPEAAETTAAAETAAAAETTGAAADQPGKPPPAGWQQRAPANEGRSVCGGDADLLLALFGALRDRIPPDLQRRLAEAIREVLLALRALIDWYLERTGQHQAGPAEVQDIPIL